MGEAILGIGSPLEDVHAAWIARSNGEQAISEPAGRRTKNPGSKNQGLRSLRAPEPDVVILAHRLVDVVPIRGTQIIHGLLFQAPPRIPLSAHDGPSGFLEGLVL